MSYILDALKKQEQDREIGHTPTVDTQQLSPWPQADRRTLILGLIIVFLSAMVAFLVGVLWSKLDGPAASSQPVAASSVVNGKLVSSPAAPVQPVRQFTPPSQSATVQHAPVTSKPALEPKPMPVERETPVVSTAPVQQREAPLLDNLSYIEREGLPPLSLDVHVYAEQVERRFVLLNLKKLKEGDKLDNIYVETITPAGVVLLHNGVRFRLQRQ